MKLNLEKCILGVKVGKFLGYIVSKRGVEANLENIKAIQDMECINDVQKLNGQITALGRFISYSAKKCLPFFKTLKGKNKFIWGK